MIAKAIALAAPLILAVGCAGKPGGNWMGVNTQGDVGALPANYKETTEAHLRSQLRDPYSAVINVGEGFRGQCAIGIYGVFHGWAVPVRLNAKNGFGGYVGERTIFVWFANGVPRRQSESPTYCP